MSKNKKQTDEVKESDLIQEAKEKLLSSTCWCIYCNISCKKGTTIAEFKRLYRYAKHLKGIPGLKHYKLKVDNFVEYYDSHTLFKLIEK